MNYPADIRGYDWHPQSPFYEEPEEPEDEEDVDEEDEWLRKEELAELYDAEIGNK